jgi:7,8-dihydroneopterin aldolase/epimerase/oxygenase
MPIADAQGARRLLVRDLVLGARIGVHAYEHQAPQRVRLNLDLEVAESGNPLADDLAQVVDYEALIERVRRLVASRHVKLVETLAEQVAALCLDDPRVRSARVRVEKLDVIPDAAAVGVEIERFNRTCRPLGSG